MQSEFTIKFDGQLNQVDVNTLIASLMGTSSVLQEINKELTPENKIDIKIVALSKGSFDIKYAIEGIAPILPLLGTIVSKDSIEYAKLVIEILTELFGLKKTFKESEPENITNLDDGRVQIGTNNGNITVLQQTFNIYSRNQIANDALSKSLEAIQNEPAIEKVKLLDVRGKVIFDATKDDFPGMASKRTILIGQTKQEIDTDAHLNIFKLVFKTKYKWEFYYKGNRISAIIKDELFYNVIDKGDSLPKATYL
jgi:hypothetical protein